MVQTALLLEGPALLQLPEAHMLLVSTSPIFKAIGAESCLTSDLLPPSHKDSWDCSEPTRKIRDDLSNQEL